MSHLGMLSTSISFLGLMVLMLAVGCLFGRRTRSIGLIVLGMAAIGMLFTRATFQPSPIYNGPPPPPIVVAPPALMFGEDGVAPDLAFHMHHGDVAAQESIEALWNKLTRPKINLQMPDSPSVTASQVELVEAAQMILSASAPGVDPFTQGWLMNAAKAIVNAAPTDGEASSAVTVGDAAPQPVASAVPLQIVGATKPAAIEVGPAVEVERRDDTPRPDWIENPPERIGNTRRIVVSTDPYVSVEECDAALRDKLRVVVQKRVDELARMADDGRYAHSPSLDAMGVGNDYIFSELCPEPEDYYIETINTSVGAMKRAYALVEFNDAQDRLLLDRWRDAARVQSVRNVASASALVVAALAFVYGLLKVDTWTRGYYTKRLFLGVPAAIIAVLFIAAAFLA